MNKRIEMHDEGYSPQRSGEFQLGDVEEDPVCPYSGGTQGHHYILQLSCHPSHPVKYQI